MAPLGVFDVSVFFRRGCGAAQQAEPEEAGGEQHQRARSGVDCALDPDRALSSRFPSAEVLVPISFVQS
jgi:hypothetical protein